MAEAPGAKPTVNEASFTGQKQEQFSGRHREKRNEANGQRAGFNPDEIRELRSPGAHAGPIAQNPSAGQA